MHPTEYKYQHQQHAQQYAQQHAQQQPRRIHNHRRNRPELNINTFDANDYSYSPDGDEYPELSTPLSPPPLGQSNQNAYVQAPAIPFKSSQRSLGSPSSPYHKGHPPISSTGYQTAANCAAAPATHGPHNKLSAQSYGGDQESDTRNARNAKDTRARLRLEPGRDTHHDWAKPPELETFLDTFPAIDMSNKENDLPHDDHFQHFDSPLRQDSSPPLPAQSSPNTRDSHDLSLSPRNVTRDSLLGNMLLSLDQFSMGQMNCIESGPGARTMSGFGDPSSYYYEQAGGERAREGTRTATTSTNPRARNPIQTGAAAGAAGRAHGYSYSSDYEAADDSSRVSSRLSRGRRSNSASTFQSHLGRVNSMREMSNQRANLGATSSQRGLHSRGGRGSKSSSTNSIDTAGYAHVLGSQRWAHGIGIPKRSSSFDHPRRQSFGMQTPEQHTQLQQHPQQPLQPWHIELPNSFFNPSTANLHNYLDDAAPTPTVPVGPRRLSTMPSMPSFTRPEPMGEPLSPVRSVNLTLERKRSNKSARSAHTTATRHSHRSTSRPNARDRQSAPSPPPPLPGAGAVPGPDSLYSAPAPHIGYEKAKEPVHPPSAVLTSAVSQAKERQPGFFRRMFGGGSKNSVANLDQSSIAASSPTGSSLNSPAVFAAANSMTSNSNSNSNSVIPTPQPPVASSSQNTKSSSNPPSRQTNSSHGLQKKPSGFFRRRKKSISVANAEAPPLPHSLPPAMIPPASLPPAPPKRLEIMAPRLQPSPVTSLRKAMDPYLKAAGSASTSGRNSPSSYRDDLALSVYHSAVEELNQPAERSPRSFSPDYEPDPRATIREVSSDSRAETNKSTLSEIRDWGAPTRDVSKPPYSYERTGSFLHDNSDSEDSPPRVRKQASQPTINSRSRSPSGAGRMTLAPIQTDLPLSTPSSNTTIRDKKLDRLTQDSMASEQSDRPSSLTLPIEGARTDSTLKTRASAASIPSLRIDTPELSSVISIPKPENPLDEPHQFVVGDPTEDDRAKAKKIFDGNEDFIPKDKAASWMGEEGPIRQRTLRAYMDLYDFANKNIITCLRDVCNRLVLRAETQQVDRILVAFAKRWCDCNPNHGFKSTGKFHDREAPLSITTNKPWRCHSHDLLFHHVVKYGSASGRYRVQNDPQSIHQEYYDYHPTCAGRFHTERLRETQHTAGQGFQHWRAAELGRA